MRYEITALDILSVGKVVAVVYGAMGVFAWLLVPLFMIMPTGPEEGAVFAKGFMTVFLLGAPLFYAAIGFVMGLIVGLVYNLMARAMGGIRFTLRETT